MLKKYTIIQWAAWFFALNFVLIFVICHWPGLTDAQGRLLGLFHIDPIDDIFHLLSGVYAAVAAWHSPKWCKTYFLVMAFLYGMDTVMGLLFSREFLNGSFIAEGLGGPNFTLEALYINLPHILITAASLWLVYGFSVTKKEIEANGKV